MKLTSDVKQRKQRSQHNSPNPNNSYKTKKKFTGSYTEVNPIFCKMFIVSFILVPRGRAPFGQYQESWPLDKSSEILALSGFVNTIDWDQNQSDLSDLTLSMHRVTGSPWIVDVRCWTWPERSRFLVLTNRSVASRDEKFQFLGVYLGVKTCEVFLWVGLHCRVYCEKLGIDSTWTWTHDRGLGFKSWLLGID